VRKDDEGKQKASGNVKYAKKQKSSSLVEIRRKRTNVCRDKGTLQEKESLILGKSNFRSACGVFRPRAKSGVVPNMRGISPAWRKKV